MEIPEEFKARIKEASKQSMAIKETLTTLFPEVFASEHYKAGTIFYKTDAWYRNNCSNPEGVIEKMVWFPYMVDVHGKKVPIQRLILLIHEKNAHEYRLIDMATGYHYSPQKIFLRRKSGVCIPEEFTRNLEVFLVGGGK